MSVLKIGWQALSALRYVVEQPGPVLTTTWIGELQMLGLVRRWYEGPIMHAQPTEAGVREAERDDCAELGEHPQRAAIESYRARCFPKLHARCWEKSR